MDNTQRKITDLRNYRQNKIENWVIRRQIDFFRQKHLIFLSILNDLTLDIIEGPVVVRNLPCQIRFIFTFF